MAKTKFKIKPETVELIGELLTKIIGATVKDKILRAVLIACVAAGESLMVNDEPPKPPRVPFTQIFNTSK